MKTESPTKIQLADYRPYPFIINRVQLIFNLEKERTIVTSRFTLKRKVDAPSEAPVILNGEALEILEIKVNGKILAPNEYIYENDILSFNGGDEIALETIVAINPLKNTSLSGLYVSSGRFCTQCEAEGFRRISFWPDRPDVMAQFFVRLEAPKDLYPILLSNGNCVSFGDYDDGRHFAEWDDPWPKPSYLFALVAGDFDNISDKFTTSTNKEVELNIYVEKGDGPRATYALDALKRSMKWDEENYGRIYDLDIFNIVAVRDFNAGAMENKGLNIFNSSLLLADPQTATDYDYARIEGVVAHEYFHNWSGNRVTCRDWFQLSLKEGFTVFRDQEFSSDMRSKAVSRIQSIIALRARQFAEDNGPNAHSVRPREYAAIDNFYTATIYEKGAEIIRVAQNILGREAFLAGAINYFEQNDGRAATIEDWLSALRQSSGNELAGIERWYSQAGTPILKLESKFENKVLEIKLSQHTPDTPNQINKDWVPIPLAFAFYNKTGSRLAMTLQGGQMANLVNLNLACKELILRFENLEEKPIISMLRSYSAPVILQSDHSDEELAVLAQFDSDFYVKWESLQTIARKSLLSGAKAIANNEQFNVSQVLLNAYGEALKNAQSDAAYCALLLQLPSTNELVQNWPDAIPEAIFKARETLAAAIYNNHSAAFNEIHAKFDFAAPFVPDAIGEGRRALNAQCMFYLGFAKDGAQILGNAYNKAQNMTDMMAALNALSRIGGEHWDKALANFKDHFGENNLVMDKYFSLKACSPVGDLVNNFNELLKDDAFEITNPNRVRAVVGAFAMSNPIGFNRADGLGYFALTQFLLEYDKVNSSVAARIATAFERVTKIHPIRRALAKKALEDLMQNQLSKQLQEIVSGIFKSL
jgi:aminopeptidase N